MKKLVVLLGILLLCNSCVFAAMGDGYSAPCSTAPNGYKYCNAIGGYYFYDEGTNKFWMPMNAVNSKGIIVSRTYAQYNAKTKAIIWTTIDPFVEMSFLASSSAYVAGQGGWISVKSAPKTPEQYKADLQKEQERREQERKKQEQAKIEAAKKAEQAKIEAERKWAENNRSAIQSRLEELKEKGELPSCKKLYWKYTVNPMYMYSENYPEPFKGVEKSEKSYCLLKNGTPTLLQFEDKKSTEGKIYRGLKLMDFTGKTKYYPYEN